MSETLKFWESLGRKPYEWITGDIVVDDLDNHNIGSVLKVENGIVYTTFEEGGISAMDITMVIPWNKRMDIEVDAE